MEEGSKRRLVGAAVVVVLLVVFVPMVFEEDTSTSVPDGALVIPPRPDLERPSASLAEPPEELATLPLPQELPPPALDEEAGAIQTDAAVSDPERALTPSESSPKTASRPSPPPPARAPAADNLSSWVVQVAAVTELARARDLENDLREKGFPAFVEQAEVKGKTYYRVRVGPDTDRERVKSIAASLKRKTGRDGLITRYP